MFSYRGIKKRLNEMCIIYETLSSKLIRGAVDVRDRGPKDGVARNSARTSRSGKFCARNLSLESHTGERLCAQTLLIPNFCLLQV